jgi:hypothetical protein
MFKRLNIALAERITIPSLKLSPIWYRFYDRKDYYLLRQTGISLDWIYANIVDLNPNGARHSFYTFLNSDKFYMTQESLAAAYIKCSNVIFSGYIYFIDKVPTGVYLFIGRNTIFFSITKDKDDEANIEGFQLLKRFTGVNANSFEFNIDEKVRYKLTIQNKIEISTPLNMITKAKYDVVKNHQYKRNLKSE